MRARSIHPEVAKLSERSLSPEEFQRWLDAETDEDKAERESLVRWFRRRYPTAGERLAYARRKSEEWTRTRPGR